MTAARDEIDWRTDPADFIIRNTVRRSAPLVPEITLALADEAVPLWQAGEAELSASELPPPFWAFAWAGGQALARHVLDRPGLVAGRTVLDIGAGGGIVAIAAAMAGATEAVAVDIDPLALIACRLNAHANGVAISPLGIDPTAAGAAALHADAILAGDICYEQQPSARLIAWLKRRHAAGVTVLIGDPGRTYFPRDRLEQVATYTAVAVSNVEDTDVRAAAVWSFPAEPG